MDAQVRSNRIAPGLHAETQVVHPMQKLLSTTSATVRPFFSINQ